MIKDDFLKLAGHIVIAIVGLLLVLNPASGIATLVKVFALLVIAVGLFFLIQYLVAKIKPHQIQLIASAVVISIGIMLLIFNAALANTVLPVIIGIGMLVSGMFRFWVAMRFRTFDATLWWLPLITAVLSIILAIIIFFNTHGTSALISIVLGLYLLISGLVGLTEVYNYSKMRKIKY